MHHWFIIIAILSRSIFYSNFIMLYSLLVNLKKIRIDPYFLAFNCLWWWKIIILDERYLVKKVKNKHTTYDINIVFRNTCENKTLLVDNHVHPSVCLIVVVPTCFVRDKKMKYLKMMNGEIRRITFSKAYFKILMKAVIS